MPELSEIFELADHDPLSLFADLEPDVQAGVVVSLFDDARDKQAALIQFAQQLSPDDRSRLAACLRTPQNIDAYGRSLNGEFLSLSERKFCLWARNCMEPRASATELAAILGRRQQRISQITGARGRSNPDDALIRAFNAASQDELSANWRNQALIERLLAYREGRLATVPPLARVLTSPPAKAGRWTAYNRPFEIRERDGSYFIAIPSLFDGRESNPMPNADEAIRAAVDAIREDAQRDMTPNEWQAAFGEDFYGEPMHKNTVRLGDL